MIELIEKFRKVMTELQTPRKKFTGLDVLVEMIFCCGFKRGEIGEITVGYLNREDIKERISLCQEQETVDLYLELLKREKSDDFNDNLQLFPGYSGSSGQRKFNRHFSEIISRVCWQEYSYDDLIAEGMEYFWRIKKIGDVQEKKEWFSKQYGKTVRTIENTLRLSPDRKKQMSKSCGHYQEKFLEKFERHDYGNIKELFLDLLRHAFYTVHRKYGPDFPEEKINEWLALPKMILLKRVAQEFCQIKFNAAEITDLTNLVNAAFLPDIKNSTLKDLKDFLNDAASIYDAEKKLCSKNNLMLINMHSQLEAPENSPLMVSRINGDDNHSTEIMISTGETGKGNELNLYSGTGSNAIMLTDNGFLKNDSITEETEEAEKESYEDSETDEPKNFRECIYEYELRRSELKAEREIERLEEKYYGDDDDYDEE